MRLIDAEFEENHYASMLINPTPDVTQEDKRKAQIIIDALKMAKTVDAEPIEKIWSVAQKVFASDLTYREAVDYVEELDKLHEKYARMESVRR